MKKPYFLHRQLPRLVREYMDSHQTVEVELATQYLIDNVFEFRHLKFKAFRHSVRNAIEWNEYLIQQEQQDTTVGLSASMASSSEEVSLDDGVDGDAGVMTDNGHTETPLKTTKISSKISNNDSALESEIESSILKKMKKPSATPVVFTRQEYTLQELQGISHLLQDVSDLMCSVVRRTEPAINLLLQGPCGSGKTTLLSAMATAMRLPVQHIEMESILFGGPLKSPGKQMQEELSRAFSGPPAVVLLHQLELLYCKESGWSSRQSEQLAVESCIIKYAAGMKTVESDKGSFLFVAETSRPEIIEWKLKSKFELNKLTVKPPEVQDKKHMLQMLCGSELSAAADLEAVALKASGFVAADLGKLVQNAKKLATFRSISVKATSFADAIGQMWESSGEPYSIQISTQDLLSSVKMVTPSLKRNGFPVIPDTTWQDIGGLQDVIESLRDRIILPIMCPERYKAYGANTRSGTLLYGPPGCGKTLLAKAVANEAGINLLNVNGPELLSMYQGESEKAVRQVFARAATVAPCVIFFDEFDSLCTRRSKDGSESGSKSTIVNMLLTEMDGFSSRQGIYMIAATNRPGLLDPAVLRPGRFDTKLFVGFPDVAGRVAVFKARTKDGTLPRLASDVDWNELANRKECEHFTGADCSNLVNIAIQVALKEADKQTQPATGTKRQREATNDADVRNKKMKLQDCSESDTDVKTETEECAAAAATEGSTNSSTDGVLYARHFEEALKKVKPSVSVEERKKYLQQKQEYS